MEKGLIVATMPAMPGWFRWPASGRIGQMDRACDGGIAARGFNSKRLKAFRLLGDLWKLFALLRKPRLRSGYPRCRRTGSSDSTGNAKNYAGEAWAALGKPPNPVQNLSALAVRNAVGGGGMWSRSPNQKLCIIFISDCAATRVQSRIPAQWGDSAPGGLAPPYSIRVVAECHSTRSRKQPNRAHRDSLPVSIQLETTRLFYVLNGVTV
jgi:hypothetical protein